MGRSLEKLADSQSSKSEGGSEMKKLMFLLIALAMFAGTVTMVGCPTEDDDDSADDDSA